MLTINLKEKTGKKKKKKTDSAPNLLFSLIS